MKIQLVSPDAAREMGMVSLTVPFADQEWAMAASVAAWVGRGGTPVALVRVPGGVEVWRDRQGMRFGHELRCTNEETEQQL